MDAPHPEQEVARLLALDSFDILDTPREQDFDEVAELASEICGTPIAVVNLIGSGRQFFKAEVGLGVRETPLDSSFCRLAILEEEFLVVPDATKDPRFDGNPLVIGEPHLRFYAGALLKTEAGHPIGTVCVLDFAPRELTALQAKTLRVLAKQVMRQLELRRALRKEQRDHVRLDLLARVSGALLAATDPAGVLAPFLIAGAGTLGFDESCTYDLAGEAGHLALTHAVGVSDEARASLRHAPFNGPLCGIVAETRRPLVLSRIRAGSDARHAVARDAGLHAFAGYPVTSRGELRGVLSFSSREADAFDQDALDVFATIARLLSIARERRETEQELAASDARSRSAQEAGRIGTFEIDIETNVMTVSPEFCRLYGLPLAAAYPASTIEDLVAPDDAARSSRPDTRRDGSAPPDVEYRVCRPDTGKLRWISRRAKFVRDASGRIATMYGTVQDVTERHEMQGLTAALLDLGDHLREAKSTGAVGEAAAAALGRTLGASRAGYARIDAASDLFEVAEDWTSPGIASLKGRHALSAFKATIDHTARGETLVVANMASASWLASDVPSYGELGVRAQIKIPLVDDGELTGLLYVHQVEPRTWTKAEVDFAHGVADRAHAALARIRAEEDQRILNEELSHRMKNMMAVIQAIAVQTLKGVTEKDAVGAFTSRLLALSAAHDVLLQRSWSAAPIESVMRSVLGTFGQAEKFDVSGPALDLGARATLSLSLLLHELTTNAIKYGALSAERGRVGVSWRVEGLDGEAAVVMTWTERGGPAVAEPTRRGLGSRLIRAGLTGTGGVDLRYRPAGFEAEMRAPLDEVRRS